MTINKEFRIGNNAFIIEFEQTSPNKIKLPNYINVIENGYALTINESELFRDITNLTPKSITNNWKEACFEQLQIVIQNHINTYKRIAPADLESYITESILLMTSLGKSLSQPISLNERYKLFKDILIALSKHLEIPVEISFAPKINFEFSEAS